MLNNVHILYIMKYMLRIVQKFTPYYGPTNYRQQPSTKDNNRQQGFIILPFNV